MNSLSNLRVRAPLRWVGFLVATLALASVALAQWSFTRNGKQVGQFLLAFLGGLVAATLASLAAPRLLTQPVRGWARRCTVDSAGIRDGRGRLVLSAKDALGAELVTTGRGRVLRVHDRRLDVYELLVADDDVARRVCEALGVDARFGILRFHGRHLITPNEFVAAIGGLVVVTLATTSTWAPVLPAIVACLIVMALSWAPSRFVVGTDGLHVRWLFRRLTFPIARIKLVTVGIEGLTVHFQDGARFFAMPPLVARRVMERVEAAIELSREGERGAIDAVLHRGERTVEAWLHELRSLLRQASYRGQAVTAGSLLAIARDTRRAALERAAAAIALAANEAARDDVLALARTTGDPELRRLFEQAARDGSVDTKRLERL